MEVLSIIKDILLVLTAIIANYIGIRALLSWKKQHRELTEYDIAKKLLKSIYRLKEAVENSRDRYIYFPPRSSSDPEERITETKEKRTWNGLFDYYNQRINQIIKTKSDVRGNLFEAEIIWNKEVRNKVDPLLKMANELINAIDDYVGAKHPDTHKDLRDEVIRHNRPLVYSHSNIEKDAYRKNFEQTIEDIEEYLRPKIKKFHNKE